MEEGYGRDKFTGITVFLFNFMDSVNLILQARVRRKRPPVPVGFLSPPHYHTLQDLGIGNKG